MTGLLSTWLAGPRAQGADTPSDSDRAQPCRPTVTCTAELVAPGELEVEVGGGVAHADDQDQWSTPFLLKLGLWRWLEMEVGSNGLAVLRDGQRTQYLDNVFAGPKLRFFEQHGALPSIALSAEVNAPTFPAAGYERFWDLFFAVYATKEFGPVHADVNGGFDVLRVADQGQVTRGSVSGAFTLDLPANFALEVAAYYLSDSLPSSQHDGGFQDAVTFAPRPWLVFDAGADWGFFPSVRRYSVFAGITIIPMVFWRSDHAP